MNMSDQLNLDEEKHVYTLGGAVVPSVTQILRDISSFDGIPVAALAYKAAIGTAVHKACELIDLGQLDESSVAAEIAGYVDAYRAFLDDMKPRLVAVESLVYHNVYGYAGKLDAIYCFDDGVGVPFVTDRKTSVEISPVVGLQTAAYGHAYYHPKSSGYRRAALQLRADGKYRWIDDSVADYFSRDDLSTFLSLLTVRNWKEKHRGRV